MRINTGCVVSPTTLFIVFLILKLTNTIDWSWWWVTSPLWAVAIAYIFVIFLIFMCSTIKIIWKL